ncbi:NAD(P)H-binding protein [Glycomyces paridis]|uniref:NAD-dependent epimerase/dehydratase family protein n=1 Tax=Glycomyces paridis TaxID=2126555 RepID=A0A4S8P2P1_9ACTN|nr:NAD(P)H-binding protein [Glycomyces paridis]THV23571.1 NAD-dependent epimerase/dehydratase family protein [Glycomyces paridis]
MIGITGTTGGVGSAAVRHLLARGRRDVVALARRPDAVPAAPGLSARRADYDGPDTLREAMRGLDTLVMVSSDGLAETMERHHRNVIGAAAEAGVGHLVYTSILDIEPGTRFYYAPGHQATETLLDASGIPHCKARTSVFADFFADTWLGAALASGVLDLPLGEGAVSLVAREDVGRGIAAAALAGAEGVVRLTGPEALTGERIAAAAARATGRPLRFAPVTDADYRARLLSEGEPGWLVEAYATMFGAVRDGRFAAAPGDVERLTGTPPASFERYLEGHRVHSGE